MKKIIYAGVFLVFAAVSCTQQGDKKNNTMNNPLLTEFTTPFGVPPFDKIKPEHYMPAFIEGMKSKKRILIR